jgi:hypothetical protein
MVRCPALFAAATLLTLACIQVPPSRADVDSPPPVPEGWMAVPVESLDYLLEEPQSVLLQAHDYSAAGSFREAADMVLRGAALVQMEESRAMDEDREQLEAVRRQLIRASEWLESSRGVTTEALDNICGQACLALTRHHLKRSRRLGKAGLERSSAIALGAAANYIHYTLGWYGVVLDEKHQVIQNTQDFVVQTVEGKEVPAGAIERAVDELTNEVEWIVDSYLPDAVDLPSLDRDIK